MDIDGDGIPNSYVTATDVSKLDQTLSVGSLNPQARQIDTNKETHWKKIVSLKIAILVRSAQGTRNGRQENEYDLFGKNYADKNAGTDTGTRIKEKELAASSRNRMRKVFLTAIYLRNLRFADLSHGV